MASPNNGAIVICRIFGAARTALVACMLSVVTSSVNGESLIHAMHLQIARRGLYKQTLINHLQP